MRDNPDKFSAMTIALHWLVGSAMIAMLVFGLILEEIENRELKSALMWWHKGLGVALLAFALARLGWRMANGMPTVFGHVPAWQERAAAATHWFLLAGTLFMPISGVMLSLGNGRAIDVLGLFTIAAGEKNEMLHEIGEVIHGAGGKLLMIAVALHVAGALKHHVVDRDRTLARMLGRPGEQATAQAESR